MPNWGEVLSKIESSNQHPADIVRRKYIRLLHEYTGRNVIAYYSGFLQKSANNKMGINDDDKNAFMQAVNKLDRSIGLDLILHTPGGDIAATESLVNYLKIMFSNDIRVIIPQIAMSAGTMIALASKEIIMGKESSIGPIDPQMGGVSCAGVIEEFKKAVKDCKSNQMYIPMWQSIIGKYHPTFLGDCEKAINWSEEIVKKWLIENMFKDDENKNEKAKNVVERLSDHSVTKSHNRHIEINEVKEMGIKVIDLESFPKDEKDDCVDLQDCVLTLHHAYMHTFSITDSIKIVENHNGSAMITHGGN